MKIALVSAYDFGIPSGVNTHISQLASALQERGHSTTIFAPGTSAPSCNGEEIHLTGRSFPVPSGGSVARVGLSPRSGRWVREHLENGDFDIVHLHEPLVPLLPLQFLRYSPVPTIGTFHAARENNSRLYDVSHHVLRRYERLLDGRVAVSKAAGRLVSKYFPGNYKVIPNGIDLNRFTSERPPVPELLDLQPYVLFVGRFEKRKGAEVLLQAFRQLKKRLPALNLVIVGGGSGRERVESLASEMGVTDVHFSGYVSNEMLPRYYRHAAVFCAPNTGNESFGIILLEAMASGTPVVASAIQGFVDVVQHDVDALLVPSGDPDALANAIEWVVTDDDTRVRVTERGAQTARRYSWDVISDELTAYYHEVANNVPRCD